MYNVELEKVLNIIEALEEQDFEINLEFEEDTLPIHLFSREEFEEGQLGYRIDEDGTNLINTESHWRESWYVIGIEELLGDPIVVDIEDSNYPIFTIEHDADKWEPRYLSNSFKNFFRIT